MSDTGAEVTKYVDIERSFTVSTPYYYEKSSARGYSEQQEVNKIKGAHLETKDYFFVKKSNSDNNYTTETVTDSARVENNYTIKSVTDSAWVEELKQSIQKTKEQLTNGVYSNKEIVDRIVSRMTRFPVIKKKLIDAVSSYYVFYGVDAIIDIRSVFNFMKFIPELNKVEAEKAISVDSDMSLISMTLVNKTYTMVLLFNKKGEVLFNIRDNDLEKIRISGSSYYSGEIKNAHGISKLLDMVRMA